MLEGGMTNPTNHSYMYTDERHAKLAVFSLTFVLGIVGNTLLLLVIRKKRKRSTNDFFIINLALADLTFLLFSLPINILVLGKMNFPESFCRFTWPMMTISNNVSIFTMCSMAIYRCRVIVHPLRPKIKQRSVLFWIAALWVTSLLAIVPLMMVAKSSPGGWCYEDWPSKKQRQAYTASLVVIQYIAPLLLIALAYIRIAFDLKFPHLFVRTQSKYVSRSVTRQQEDIRVIKTLATVVILFAIFMLPGQVAWMLMDFGDARHKKIAETLFKFYDLSAYFHCCLDPIVYGALMKHFRQEMIRSLLRVFRVYSCCIQGATENEHRLSNREETIAHCCRRIDSSAAEGSRELLPSLKDGGLITLDTILTDRNVEELSLQQKETAV